MPESSTIETSNRPNEPAVEAAAAGRVVYAEPQRSANRKQKKKTRTAQV